MHIPSLPTNEIEISDFDISLSEYESCPNPDFSKDDWLYIPCRYCEYRYILGTRGKNPLICVGVNPSTAEPGNLDNTLKSVDRIAGHNGFDSFIMFNVYAQRATNPDDMDAEMNPRLHEENMKAFEYVLKKSSTPSVWAAWGAVIEKRTYLAECVHDMISVGIIRKACLTQCHGIIGITADVGIRNPFFHEKNLRLNTYQIFATEASTAIILRKYKDTACKVETFKASILSRFLPLCLCPRHPLL